MFTQEFLQMIIRLGLNFLVTFILVRFLYYPKSKRRSFYFTFMMISVAIFFLVYYMIFALEDMKAKTSMGIGIGLFGIFSIMRYRTDAMPVREMTYLFVIIAMSVVNAIGAGIHLGELIVADIFILGLTTILEFTLKIHPSKLVQYDRIELITPARRAELIADLEQRTGLSITDVEVGSIDFLKDMAVLKIHYRNENATTGNPVDQKLKLTRQDLATV